MIGNPFITNDKEKRVQNPTSSVPKGYWGWKEPAPESISEPVQQDQVQIQQERLLGKSGAALTPDEQQAIKRKMMAKMMGLDEEEVEAEQYNPEQKQMIKELGWDMNPLGSPIIPEDDINQINEGIKVYQQGLPIDRRTEMILRVMTDLYDEEQK